MNLSPRAAGALQKIAAEYVKNGHPERHNIAWKADSEDEEAAYSELQASGILEGHTVSNRRLTEYGLELVMESRS